MADLDQVDPDDDDDVVGAVLAAPSHRCACGRPVVVVLTEWSSDGRVSQIPLCDAHLTAHLDQVSEDPDQ